MLMIALALLAADDDATVRDAIVTRCEIPVERIGIEADEPNDIRIVTIRGAAPLSDAQLDCFGTVVAEAAALAPSFEDEALGKHYARVAGRSNLMSMGLLERLPVFDPARDTLRRFARKLERLCKVRPGTMLEADDGNIHLLRSALDLPSERYEPVICLISALDASGFNAFAIDVPIPMTETPTTPSS